MKPFFPKNNSYSYDINAGLSLSEVTERALTTKKQVAIDVPIDIDTEYQSKIPKYNDTFDRLNISTLVLTTQIKSIAEKEGEIYTHWDMAKLPDYPDRYQPLDENSNHVIEDYLRSHGIDCTLVRVDDCEKRKRLKVLRKLRVLRIVLFAHYAVADVLKVSKGQFRKDLEAMMVNPVYGSKITQKRHLETTFQRNSDPATKKEGVKMYWYAKMGVLDYAVELVVHDTGALHGPIGLDSLANNTGTHLPYKDTFDKTQKGDMLSAYLDHTNGYTNYALGDLVGHESLVNNSNQFKLIHKALGIDDYYQLPRKTLGATVARMINGKLATLFEGVYGGTLKDDDVKEVLEKFVQKGSSAYLVDKEKTTGGLLAKVVGGRCYNNRHLNTTNGNVLGDIDISGCYGEGLRGQLYPIGNPAIIEYDKLAKNNKYLTVGEFIKRYRKELVSGLWVVWFSVTIDRTSALKPKPIKLVSPQDYFPSYKPPNKWSDIISDTEKQELEDTKNWLELPDKTKIYSHQITNSVLTHDGLQWLENVCSRPLRNQILNESIVVTAAFYPASDRVNSIEELVKATNEHEGQNTSEVVKGEYTEVHNVDRECKKWFGVPMGELMVDTLMLERKKYPKKTALNTLFKLCTNTVYGVMVAKYFNCSNSVVGQNVTARARSMAWCLEKGLCGHQTITDGAVFDLNSVAYSKPKQKLNDSNVTATNRYNRKELNSKNVVFKPLNDFNNIEWTEDEQLSVTKDDVQTIYSVSDFRKEVDKWALKHLQNQFKGLDILHKNTKDVYGNEQNSIFVFESKGVVRSGVFHGSANYYLIGGEHDGYSELKELVAFRSYKKELESSPVNLCKMLLDDISSIDRQEPFVKRTIVKVGDYSQRYNSFFKYHTYSPGDTMYEAGILRECSLSQFLFMNAAQRDSWEKEYTKLKDFYGQSYEAFFCDHHTGKLDYQRMLETIDNAIVKGCMSFGEYLKKHWVGDKPTMFKHPNHETYLEMKRHQCEDNYSNPSEDDVNNSEFTIDNIFEDDLDWGDDDDAIEVDRDAIGEGGSQYTEDLDW